MVVNALQCSSVCHIGDSTLLQRHATQRGTSLHAGSFMSFLGWTTGLMPKYLKSLLGTIKWGDITDLTASVSLQGSPLEKSLWGSLPLGCPCQQGCSLRRPLPMSRQQ